IRDSWIFILLSYCPIIQERDKALGSEDRLKRSYPCKDLLNLKSSTHCSHALCSEYSASTRPILRTCRTAPKGLRRGCFQAVRTLTSMAITDPFTSRQGSGSR